MTQLTLFAPALAPTLDHDWIPTPGARLWSSCSRCRWLRKLHRVSGIPHYSHRDGGSCDEEPSCGPRSPVLEHGIAWVQEHGWPVFRDGRWRGERVAS